MKLSTLFHSYRVFRNHLFYYFSQHWKTDKIGSYQDKMLIRLINHASKNVPYYRNLFNEIGLDPQNFRGRIDMNKIPILDKETFRKRQSEFIADDSSRYGINWESTSGSTGKPLRLIIDNNTKAHKLACVIRSYQWAGYLPWKKTFSIQSYKFENPKAISKRYTFVNLWRFNARLLSKESSLKIIEMINTIKPGIFIGYPFSILMLSKFAEDYGISIHPFESIVTAGETLSPKRRRAIEDAYQCKVHDFYSMHEDASIITECKYHAKHICEDFAYNEILDENGNDAKDKASGELIGTNLYNYAMPLIRYRTGDTVKVGNQKLKCRCGSYFRVIEEIVGRQNDYIETPDGRFIGNVLEHSVDKANGVIISQCVQDQVDHIYINLITDQNFTERSKHDLEAGLRQRIGNDIRIDFNIVDELEKKKNGKTPFIYSKIGHDYI